ncbi:coagulation factor V-like [Dicentrarchus labrax]|uniref:coagulation factor V-like n=1 Tax=Dicentrarchus labrax TaxID=13489 RepID=UPI0021F5DE3C|nr:coagulation factor V-like [Dicentrarchus labrax]
MANLRTILCAVFMVTAVLSKPLCLNEGEDSSESSQLDSSEEAATDRGPSQEPLQPAFADTDVSDAVEETDSPSTAAPLPSAGPSPAMLNTSAMPEDPQASTDTDALQLMPDDPSQTALGVDVSQDMPNSDPAQDSINADTEFSPHLTETDTIIGTDGTNQPQVTTTTTYQGFPQGATPPFSTAPPLPVHIGTALTGVPVCFTFQLVTPEPDPPRGDSI